MLNARVSMPDLLDANFAAVVICWILTSGCAVAESVYTITCGRGHCMCGEKGLQGQVGSTCMCSTASSTLVTRLESARPTC